MKKLVLAAALASAFAGSAFAQSSVSLYGRINTSIEYQDNETIDKTGMRNVASRWGLRGSEDLGGGLSAFFQLEAGFASDTGEGSGGFSRDAFVGLKSASLGQIKVGRILLGALYSNTIDWIGVFNHDTGTTAEDNLYALPYVFNNAVEYTTPTFGGFSLALTANAGEGNPIGSSFANDPGYGNANKTYEGVLAYDKGDLHVAGGYSYSEDIAGNDAIKGFSAAASYVFGPLFVGLAYENDDVPALGKRNQVTGTAMYTVGASEFHLSAGWADDWDNVANSKAFQYTLGYNYNLSKRTKVYGFYHAIDNDGGTLATPVVYGGGVIVPALADSTFSSVGIGIRHNF